MMDSSILTMSTAGAYLASTALIGTQLRTSEQRLKRWIITIATIALVAHGLSLISTLFTTMGTNVSLNNMASLVSWIVALLVVIESQNERVEGLLVTVFPLAAITVLLAYFFPGEKLISNPSSGWQWIHIMLSISAYSLLNLAALQALLLALQNSQLHHNPTSTLLRALPPLQSMENLLFKVIVTGFIFLSLSLLSGALFVEDLLAQHLAHKTVLSLLAWVLFATLIWGHMRYGWRGKVAVRWTLGAYFSLMLAYFGTKFVLEWILLR